MEGDIPEDNPPALSPSTLVVSKLKWETWKPTRLKRLMERRWKRANCEQHIHENMQALPKGLEGPSTHFFRSKIKDREK
jgi:hypothetical protein